MAKLDKAKFSGLETLVKIEKCISYIKNSEFIYYYPRICKLKDETADEVWQNVIIQNIIYDLDLLIAICNHIIEVNAFSYEQFRALANSESFSSLGYQVSLETLLFEIFDDEFSLTIYPLLQLASSFIQVEASFDKFYFMGKISGLAYRYDPNHGIIPFEIISHDLTSIKFKQNANFLRFPTTTKYYSEHIITSIEDQVYSWLK